MRGIYSLSGIFISYLLCVPQAFGLQPSNLVLAIQKTENYIESQIQAKQIPGCAIVIVYRDQILLMNGYGVRTVGQSEKVDTQTVFQLGSVSKPIAASLATILEQQGYLHLNDPVNDYLPDFKLNTKQDPNQLKLKHILSHTSGLPRHGFNHLIENFASRLHIIRSLSKTKVKSTIGKKYDYHNAMYSLIDEVTHAATRQSFGQALKMYLLNPLNMSQTTASYEELLRSKNRASPHTRARKGKNRPTEAYSKGYYHAAPAGGINSSISDMAIFLKAQMGAYPHVLPKGALERMHTPVVATQNALNATSPLKNPGYGLGWRTLELASYRLIYHGGWLKGFTNFIGFLPDEELGIVVLHNSDSRFSSKLGMKFFEAALGLSPSFDIKPPKSKLSSKAKKAKGAAPAKKVITVKKAAIAKKTLPVKKAVIAKKMISAKKKAEAQVNPLTPFIIPAKTALQIPSIKSIGTRLHVDNGNKKSTGKLQNKAKTPSKRLARNH